MREISIFSKIICNRVHELRRTNELEKYTSDFIHDFRKSKLLIFRVI